MDQRNSARRPGISAEELELLAYLMAEEGLESDESQAIRPRDPQVDPPLSFAQERLWFVDQWEPGNLAYNIPLAVWLTGRLDQDTLEWSLNQVIRRHEALRTTFPVIDDHPIQAIVPSLALPIEAIDIEHLPAEQREPEALRLAVAEARHKFDLQHGPLLRAVLMRLTPTRHLFLLNIHHIIFDGWSMGLLIREITTLYAARISAPPELLPDLAGLLPELPIQYADIAIWQREWFQGEQLQNQINYWLEQLRGPLPVLQLHTDRPRPPVQTSRGALEHVVLPEDLTTALTALSQQEDSSLFMTLLAAFNVLLARYSGQDDILIGSPIANRDRFEFENLMGFFVNTLLLRTDLTGDPSFRELLRRVRAMTLAAYAHQNVPFEQLVSVLRPERDPSYTPLFQVMFILQNAPLPSYNLPDLTLTPQELDTGTAKFDLTLFLWPPTAGADNAATSANGLTGALEYNTDLFDAETIRRMVRHFQTLLAAIVRDPNRPIADLLFVPEDEQQLLAAWSLPLEPYDHALCLHELFARQAARTPEAVAVVFDRSTNDQRRPTTDEGDKQTSRQADDESQTQNSTLNTQNFSSILHPPSSILRPDCLTYAELDRRSNQLAHYLQGLGVGPERRVGLLVERSPEMIVGLLGVLKAGGAYVPLDPAYPPERLAFILRDAQIGVLLTQQRLLDRLPAADDRPTTNDRRPTTDDRPTTNDKETRRQGDKETRGQGGSDDAAHNEHPTPDTRHPTLSVVCLDADWPAIGRASSEPPRSTVCAGNLAYVIYTSGSTGQPKGVLTPHQAVVNYLHAVQATYGLRAEDRVLQFASLSFDISAEEIYSCLTSGSTLVLRTDWMLASAANFFDTCREWGLSVLSLPTAYWHELCAQLDTEYVAVPVTLRLMIIGGERALPARLAQWQRWAGTGVRLINTYGPTETTIVATAWEATQPAEMLRELPIGRTLHNVLGSILDQRLHQVPIGVPGQLYLSGAGLARGYLNRPELTAERFVPNPFTDRPTTNDQRPTTDDRRPTTDDRRPTRRQGDKEIDLSAIGYRLSADCLATQHSKLNTQNSRLYTTGDLTRYLADGTIEFLGRVDDQVKIRGFRIEPGEVTAVLQQHPNVRESLVVARADAQGRTQLVAYVVPKLEDGGWKIEDRNTGADEMPSSILHPPSSILGELRGFLKERLPEYMIPTAYVLLDGLPLTVIGKIDYRALPAPEGRPLLETDYVVPSTTSEQTIAEIWRQVLDVDRVGVHDNFFDLGGQSLRLIQVQSQIRARLGYDVPLVELFRRPTIRDLALFLNPPAPPASALRPAKTQLPGSVTALADIAIISMSGRFPGATTVEQLWENVQAGINSIRFFSDDELRAAGVDSQLISNPAYVKARGILDQIDQFDAGFFGYSPREAEVMDPQQRLFLECAWEALERAGYPPATEASPIGIFGGGGVNGYLLNLLAQPELLASIGGTQAVLGNEKDYLATRVAYKLNLRGPSITVQTACSTSLVAVHLACQSLRQNECTIALAGGVSLSVPQIEGYLYQHGGTHSPDGHCRAFDISAQGAVTGNGVGIVVLKRLDEALADGDQILAVIKGSAINNDGAQKVGYTAPSVDGQAAVIGAALRMAGINPETIRYVEAHGTGTPLGDPIEVAALKQVYGEADLPRGWCALGSIKTNIGHLDAASGVTGLIKAVLALQHGQIPPSLHFKSPNPTLELDSSPFYVNTKLERWPADTTPRRASVNSFGIGGANAHVILEAAPELEADQRSRPWQLLLLSTKTESALDSATDRLIGHLEQHPTQPLADIAYTLQGGRKTFEHRRILVCRDRADALDALKARDPKRIFTRFEETDNRCVVFMFPGLGEQYVNMAAGLYQAEPTFRQQIDRCAEYLIPIIETDLREILFVASGQDDQRPAAGGAAQEFDLRKMLRPDGQDDAASQRLNETSIAHPLIFVIEYALARLWIEWGVRPQAMIGHSLGEYVAACLAGVFTLEDALLLVARRAQMIETLPPGAMLAVPLAESELQPLLQANGARALSLAAVNGPELCVVAGALDAVAALEQQLVARGLACRRLQAAHAFHSRMMEPVAASFGDLLATIDLNPPAMPYLSNVTGGWATAEVAQPDYWIRHMCQTVRFAQGIRELLQVPDRVLLEVGPGQSLGSFALQQAGALATKPQVLSSLRYTYHRQPDEAFILDTLGQLWLLGVPIDWGGFYSHERRRRVLLPTYPFERRRYWLEPSRSGAPVTPPTSDSNGEADPSRWFYVPSWQRATPPSQIHTQPAQRSSWWLIFEGQDSVGRLLPESLEQAGLRVVSVQQGFSFDRSAAHSYAIDPSQPEHYRALLEQLEADGCFPRQIAHLWSLAPYEHPTQSDSFTATQASSYASLLLLAQALAAYPSQEVELCVVTSGVHMVTGDDGDAPECATVLGPCQTIPLEYPHLTCRHIDIALPRSERSLLSLSKQLTAELVQPGDDWTVAYRGGWRWTPQMEALRLEAQPGHPPRLRDGGVYIVVGGVDGSGAAIAQYLAHSVHARVALIGLDGETSRRVQQMRALETAGAITMMVSADPTSTEQLRAALTQVRERFGAIHGLIYAMELPLQEPIWANAPALHVAHLRSVLELAALCQDLDLEVLVLCSTLDGMWPGRGGTAAGAVHALLAALTRRMVAVQSISASLLTWERWAGPSDREHDGIIAAFERLIWHNLPEVIIAPHRPSRDARRAAFDQPTNEQIQPLGSRHIRPSLTVNYVEPRNDVERTIAAIWQELLGIEQIGIYDNFFVLGGHSLLGTQLLSRLRDTFQQDLQLRDVLEAATIAELAALIVRDRAAQVDQDQLAALLSEIQDLSPEEVQRLLLTEPEIPATGGVHD